MLRLMQVIALTVLLVVLLGVVAGAGSPGVGDNAAGRKLAGLIAARHV